MKKIICLAFAFSALAYSASAQFYISGGLGYAFPQAGQTVDGTGQPYNGTSNNGANTETFNIKGASFSAGLQGAIGIGYMFSEHVGVQLDMNVGLSTKKYTFSQDSVEIGGVLNNYSVVQQAKSPVFLIPSLVLQTGDENKVNLYSRFGIVLPMKTTITQDQVEVNLPGTGTPEALDFTVQIKNSFALGFSAAVGVKYKVSDRLSIFGEASLLSMSVYVKEADLTSFSYNGQNQSLSYVSGPQTIKYSKNTAVDSADQVTYAQPFSNIGIKVGVTYNLSEKRRSKHSRHSDVEVGDDKPFRRR